MCSGKGSLAEMTDLQLKDIKPELNVYMYGLSGSGQNNLLREWAHCSMASAVKQFANVQLHLEEGLSEESLSLLCNPQKMMTSLILIFYSQINEGSVNFAWSCLNTLRSVLDGKDDRLFLLENSADLSEEIYGPPPGYQWDSVPFLTADINNPIELTALFKQIILQPLLETLSDTDVQQITLEACKKGQIEVVKLLLSSDHDPQPLKWLEYILEVLDTKSCIDHIVKSLLEIAELAYNLDKQSVMDYVTSKWSITPRAVPLITSKFINPFNTKPEHLLLPRLGLTVLSPSSIADSSYTHISLSGNQLGTVPEELFQLRSLETLDLSHNSLEKVPSLLRWNCPKLRELNLSFNCLTDPQRGVIRRHMERRQSSFEDEDRHAEPQRKVLQLTNHNIYPCIHSLINVDLSWNPKLTQVPEWVCVLPHLVILNLKGLPKLRELPKNLANWKSLSIIRLQSEKMIIPPAKICAQGSQSIMTYLRCQLRGSANYRHMNLMLLGWKGAGKSTLFKGLLGQKSTTSSVSMETGTFDYRGETRDRNTVRVTYHVIDFTDEAMSLSVYQCFIIRRCVYLCLWDLAEGKKGLEALVPILRNIKSRLPEAKVLLIATHADQSPEVTLPDIYTWEGEIFQVDSPSSLYDEEYSDSYGLPCLSQPILINTLAKQNIETLKKFIHVIASELKVEKSQERMIEEMVPRSYTGLQSHIESKAKHLKEHKSIVRRSELIDSFRAISHQTGDLSDDDKEFALACQFLHESGTIFHYDSTCNKGQSDCFFLNVQWLSDTLAKVLNTCKTEKSNMGTIDIAALMSVLEGTGIPSLYHKTFVYIMEKYDLVVALNMDREQFLLPTFLLPAPPQPHYPCYDLANKDLLLRNVIFKYLPESFFSRLLSRIFLYIDQLAIQLLTLKHTSIAEEQEVSPQYCGKTKRGKYFKLERGDYIVHEKVLENMDDSVIAARALSVNEPANTMQREAIYSKIQTLSKNFIQQQLFFPLSDVWINAYTFSRCLLWKRGMHIQFLDGTLAWIESESDSITIVTVGTELVRVKALVSLLSSLEVVAVENYSNLKRNTMIPCTECIKICTLVKEGTSSEEYSSNDPNSEYQLPLNLVSKINFFPLPNILTKLSRKEEGPLVCQQCQKEPDLHEMAPDIFFTDFPGHLRLERDQLKYEKNEETSLGKGGYAGVFQGTYNEKPVAIKIFRNDTTDTLTAMRRLRSELNILTSIGHPQIIKPLGVLLEPLCIVFPLAPLGSLYDHLELCPSGLNDQVSHILLHQIAEGIKYLHSLHIIHRDIKPSNILVWSLHPVHGICIKITDCGLSQYASPSGLYQQRGTEDYMAPELFLSAKKRAYNEKVDIFSFGVLLYNVVTGKSFIPTLNHKSDTRDRQLMFPCLGSIATAVEEQRPRGDSGNIAPKVLENGVHPAGRQGQITTCISICMQMLFEDCLAFDPDRRPSADGVSGRLLICIGPSTQEKVILDQDCRITHSVLLSSGDIVAWEDNIVENRVILLTRNTLTVKQVLLNIPEQPTMNYVCASVGNKLFVASSTKRLHCFSIPDFKNVLTATVLLPSLPTCILSSDNADHVVVGMEGGKIAVFKSQNGQSVLSAPPLFSNPFDHLVNKKKSATCGVVLDDIIVCNSGRYLVGLDVETLQQKFYKLVSEKGTMLKGIVCHGKYLWVWFTDSREIIVCDVSNGNQIDSININILLQDSISEIQASTVLVTMVTASPKAMWVGTTTGHLLGFHHESFELITAIRQHACVDTAVCTPAGMLLVFGRWSCGISELEQDATMVGGFAVWQLHVDNFVLQ